MSVAFNGYRLENTRTWRKHGTKLIDQALRYGTGDIIATTIPAGDTINRRAIYLEELIFHKLADTRNHDEYVRLVARAIAHIKLWEDTHFPCYSNNSGGVALSDMEKNILIMDALKTTTPTTTGEVMGRARATSASTASVINVTSSQSRIGGNEGPLLTSTPYPGSHRQKQILLRSDFLESTSTNPTKRDSQRPSISFIHQQPNNSGSKIVPSPLQPGGSSSQTMRTASTASSLVKKTSSVSGFGQRNEYRHDENEQGQCSQKHTVATPLSSENGKEPVDAPKMTPSNTPNSTVKTIPTAATAASNSNLSTKEIPAVISQPSAPNRIGNNNCNPQRRPRKIAPVAFRQSEPATELIYQQYKPSPARLPRHDPPSLQPQIRAGRPTRPTQPRSSPMRYPHFPSIPRVSPIVICNRNTGKAISATRVTGSGLAQATVSPPRILSCNVPPSPRSSIVTPRVIHVGYGSPESVRDRIKGGVDYQNNQSSPSSPRHNPHPPSIPPSFMSLKLNCPPALRFPILTRETNSNNNNVAPRKQMQDPVVQSPANTSKLTTAGNENSSKTKPQLVDAGTLTALKLKELMSRNNKPNAPKPSPPSAVSVSVPSTTPNRVEKVPSPSSSNLHPNRTTTTTTAKSPTLEKPVPAYKITTDKTSVVSLVQLSPSLNVSNTNNPSPAATITTIPSLSSPAVTVKRNLNSAFDTVVIQPLPITVSAASALSTPEGNSDSAFSAITPPSANAKSTEPPSPSSPDIMDITSPDSGDQPESSVVFIDSCSTSEDENILMRMEEDSVDLDLDLDDVSMMDQELDELVEVVDETLPPSNSGDDGPEQNVGNQENSPAIPPLVPPPTDDDDDQMNQQQGEGGGAGDPDDSSDDSSSSSSASSSSPGNDDDGNGSNGNPSNNQDDDDDDNATTASFDDSEESDEIDDENLEGREIPNWRSLPTNSLIRYIFTHDEGTRKDVTFHVGPDCEPICGHKALLSVISPIFDAMMYPPEIPPRQHLTIPLVDVEPKAFQILLKYIYFREWKDDPSWDIDMLLKILYAANKFQLIEASARIRASLRGKINLDTVTFVLDQAVTTVKDVRLTELALHFIEQNATQVLQNSTQFALLSLDGLCTILESDRLRADEEIVYNAAVTWADKRLSARVCESGPDTKFDGSQIRSELGRALHLIRFPLMKIEFFLSVVADSDLLPAKPDQAVLTKYIAFKKLTSAEVPDPSPYSVVPRAARAGNTPIQPELSQGRGDTGGTGGNGNIEDNIDGGGGSRVDNNGGDGNVRQPPPRTAPHEDEPSPKKMKLEEVSNSEKDDKVIVDMNNLTITPGTAGIVTPDTGNLIIVDDEMPGPSSSCLPQPLMRPQTPLPLLSTPSKKKELSNLLSPSEEKHISYHLSIDNTYSYPTCKTLHQLYSHVSLTDPADRETITESEVVLGVNNYNFFLVPLPCLKKFHVDYLYDMREKNVAKFKDYLSKMKIQRSILFFKKQHNDLATLWDSEVDVNLKVNGITVLNVHHASRSLGISRLSSSADKLLSGLKLGDDVESLAILNHVHLDEVTISSLNRIPTSNLKTVILRKVKGIKDRAEFIKRSNRTLTEFSCDDMSEEVVDFGMDIGLFNNVNNEDNDGGDCTLRRIALGKARLECSIPSRILTASPIQELYLDNCTYNPDFVSAIPLIFPNLRKVKVYSNVTFRIVQQFLEIGTLEWLCIWDPSSPKKKYKKSKNNKKSNSPVSPEVAKLVKTLEDANLGSGKKWWLHRQKPFILEKLPLQQEDGTVIRKWSTKLLGNDKYEEFSKMDFAQFGWSNFYKDYDLFEKIHQQQKRKKK